MATQKTEKASPKVTISGTTPESIAIRKIKFPGIARSFTTPDVYKAGIYAIWGGTLLLTGAVISAVMAQRNVVEEVGFNTTPSIYHAQRIRDSIADLDANVANLLLVPPGGNPSAEDGYQKRKEKLSDIIVQSSKNITIPAEEKYISDIILGVNNYIEKTQQARDFHAQKNTEASLQAYREAQKIVDDEKTGLMKIAEELDSVNFQALNSSFTEGQKVSAGQSLIVFFAGATLLTVLIVMQLALAKWNRRMLNPALLGATVLAAFFLLDTLVSLNKSSQQVQLAKKEAFDSLHSLRKARSMAYALNAEESRYLLDSAYAPQHEKEFSRKVNKLAAIGVIDPVRQSSDYQTQFLSIAQSGKATTDLRGLFEIQLNNITFPGEQESTQIMLKDFAKYLSIDTQIRSLNASGKRAEAIILCTGDKQGQSNEAFKAFLKSHSDTMNINIKEFNAAIKKAQASLDVSNPRDAITDNKAITTNSLLDIFWLKTFGIAGAIAGLTYYGLTQRIKEYEV